MNCYFFGTFNPIHLGHIEIARRVKELLGFDRVIFVPAYIPPHKTEALETYIARLEMVKLAVGEENASNIESKLKVPSFTYRTIEKLTELTNEQKINFIIGYDQFFTIENWREPEILRQKIHFIVIPRKFSNGQVLGDAAFQYFKKKNYDFEILDINFLDVSSDMIRKLIQNNEDITGLVKKEVKEYIETNRLYTPMAKRQFI